jgi:hypothetical protein
MDSGLKCDQSPIVRVLLVKQFGGLYGLAPITLEYGCLAQVW